ncbi:MAG: hydrolase 1, exosortase A system-associated [Nitrosospira sp.]|nr:hydrolase 1, exosortase A system-associated [Nitrosospira sp.]
MKFEERALIFPCNDSWLYGILSLPEPVTSRGVLIVVGGPQYRVGSHRQFTLLARDLAANGIAVVRFDYRGMGDSEGNVRTFEDLQDDLRCTINRFFEEVPSLSELVIWGLCDAAAAALFYAYQDRRITGLVLLNPWVRTDEGAARTYLKHYYLSRLFEPQLWRKISRGNFDFSEAIRSFLNTIGTAIRGKTKAVAPLEQSDTTYNLAPLPERMLDGLSRFEGQTLLIMSGNDLTAQEFSNVVNGSRDWKKLLASPRVSRRDLPGATHTFSRREWRDQVAVWTKEWIRTW